METLQNAYRDDDDDDDASIDMDLSPNPNLIPDPTDPNLPHALGSEAAVTEEASSSEAAGMTEALGSEVAAMAEALGSKPAVMAEAPSLEVAGMAETVVMAEAAEKSKLLGSETALMNEALGSEATGMAGKGDILGLERIGKVEALGSETTGKVEAIVVEEISSDSMSESEHKNNNNNAVEILECSEMKKSEGEDNEEENDDDETTMETLASKKQKSLTLDHLDAAISGNVSKKPSKKKSKSNSVWTKPTSRKGKKKPKNGGNNNNNNNQSPPKTENEVLVTPMPRFPDKNDDNPESKICLSKVHKAEKVELSEDRLSAGSCKGYRMVRATRGVSEGAWYFEIKVVHLGDSGHTRLGWSNERGDLQAPVGYDGNSFGYRDIDGCKIHKALREKYGEEGYKQGDVIGFYINLPEGESYAPKGPHLVLYKGQKYVCASNSKEDPPKCVPGSEISFFKNGVCQGVAFKDLYGGRYYPAASMYTLPNQPNCVVKFNFGPDFECFPADFEGRPVPRPMIEVPYHGYEDRVENGVLDENKQ